MEDSSLKQKTISGIIWSAVQRFGTMIISFVSNIVLARLLTPDDFGCIGLLAIFIVVANVFVNGGFAAALIQKPNPSKEDYSTVFIWNILVSMLFYLGLYISAPHIAVFYSIPLLSAVLKVQGIVLIINALSVIHLSVLRKNLQFKEMSIIQIIAISISVATAIVLALKGWGVWALVAQQLLNSAIITISLWLVCNWKPKLVFSWYSFRQLFNYGAFLLLSDILNSICDNIQGLVIGRRFTAGDMGYYSQAKKLEEVPTQSISQVVSLVSFPVFAKLQNDKQKLYVAVRKSLMSMNFLNFPLMILLVVVAEPLLTLLYSDRWLDAIPYFRILCISGIVNCMQSVNYQVVCAVGKSKVIFKWNIVKRIVGIGLIFIGMYWGIEGILWGMVAGFYFTFAVNAMVAAPTTGYSLFRQLFDAAPVLMIAVVAAAGTMAIGMTVDLNYIFLLIVQVFVYLLIYIGMARLMRRLELDEYVNIIKSYFFSHD